MEGELGEVIAGRLADEELLYCINLDAVYVERQSPDL